MQQNPFFRLILIAFFVAGFSSASAGTPNDYWKKSKEGWFWYHDPIPPEEKVQETEEQTPDTHPPPPAYTVQELMDLHPDDFQEHYNAVLKYAVYKATPENAEKFMEVQDVARRKALRFSKVASYVVQQQPRFSVLKDYPQSSPGKIARLQMQNQEIQTTIANAKGDHALLYFRMPGCKFCVAQDGILSIWQQRYGWPVKPINTTERPDLAAFFGIETTPTLLLITRRKRDAIPVGVGVTSLNRIEQAVFRGIRLLSGKISPEEYGNYDFQQGSSFDVNDIPAQANSRDLESIDLQELKKLLGQ